MRMQIKQVRKDRVTVEEAAEDAEMTVEEFKKVMEKHPVAGGVKQKLYRTWR